MLNTEIIKSQEGLNDLTEDQLQTIVTLANNTIKSEVSTKAGKLRGLYDQDILRITGVPKVGAEANHIYFERAFNETKGQNHMRK